MNDRRESLEELLTRDLNAWHAAKAAIAKAQLSSRYPGAMDDDRAPRGGVKG
jgi:hypothetical protein